MSHCHHIYRLCLVCLFCFAEPMAVQVPRLGIESSPTAAIIGSLPAAPPGHACVFCLGRSQFQGSVTFSLKTGIQFSTHYDLNIVSFPCPTPTPTLTPASLAKCFSQHVRSVLPLGGNSSKLKKFPSDDISGAIFQLLAAYLMHYWLGHQ